MTRNEQEVVPTFASSDGADEVDGVVIRPKVPAGEAGAAPRLAEAEQGPPKRRKHCKDDQEGSYEHTHYHIHTPHLRPLSVTVPGTRKAAGADKPFSPDDLIRVVRDTLETARYDVVQQTREVRAQSMQTRAESVQIRTHSAGLCADARALLATARAVQAQLFGGAPEVTSA